MGCDISKARSALPSSATNIDEHFSGTFDYSRFLKAQITKNEFKKYAKKLGYDKVITKLDVQEINNKYYINWKWIGGVKKPDWWTCTNLIKGTYYKIDKKNEFYSILKYECGFVYYKAVKN